jgi:Ni,Fe-hydrogenase III large subunit
MTRIPAILQGAAMQPCRPWPRYVLTQAQWLALMREPLTLLGAWADTHQAHALFEDAGTGLILPVSIEVDTGFYPALSPSHPAAALFERAIHDLWGHKAADGEDRPWLDHGHWPHTHPLAIRPGPRPPTAEPPEFQEVAGDALMQWPIGPVGPGIGEAQHLRLTLDGTKIVRAECRLGYTHKGTLTLMRAKSPRTAARFAARLAGDATVAHALAFALATEAALDVEAPPRAATLRTTMAALERVATRLDDLCTLAAMLGAAHLRGRCGVQQEYLRRGLAATFGHRLAMDCVVPGGVAGDADANGLSGMRQILGALLADLPAIRDGFVADSVAGRLEGLGLHDRCLQRLDAIAEDVATVIPLLSDMPEGPLSVALPLHSGEGLGRVPSARGDIWHWIRLDHGQIAAVFPIDPGWHLWNLAMVALVGIEARDAGLICCSLGLPVSGMDL